MRGTMILRADLLDVNVWLALVVSEHPAHERARRYWMEESADKAAFCQVTRLGLLRLLTNDRAMGGKALRSSEAWKVYQNWLDEPDVITFAEPGACESILGSWAARDQLHPKLWTDAYLAAFAISGRLRMVSFDRDFERFDGLDWLHLVA